ncbi:MAG TPA: hypothetical protein VIK10_03490 [Prolixibacteraceae bacterium]
MADVHEPEVRSYNMSRIRSKDTKPELLVRKFLFKNGFRYRLHAKDLPESRISSCVSWLKNQNVTHSPLIDIPIQTSFGLKNYDRSNSF